MNAAAIAEVARVAAELRDLPRDAIIDVQERVHRDLRFARRLERAVEVIRDAVSPDPREVTPRTARPCERRRTVKGPKGAVVVESRRG